MRTVVRTDFEALEHVRPIRSATVILAVLSVTSSRHDVRALLPLGIGMVFAAIADRGVGLRRRLASMAVTTITIVCATAIGGLVSADQVLHVTMAGVVGILCGLAGIAGIPAMTVGMLGLVIFTIFSGAPIDLLHWTTNAALVAVGALIMIGSSLLEIGVIALLGRSSEHPRPASRPPFDSLWDRSRMHLHLSDQFVVHAIRLGIVVAIATALEELVSFPHSYWIPMTVAWISRPDRDGTVEKVLLRVVGTLVGVALAGLLIGLTPASTAESMIMIAIAAYFTLAFLAPNYTVAVTGITVFVFFLFHVVGYPLDSSIWARIVATLIAAALVLAAVQLGPRR